MKTVLPEILSVSAVELSRRLHAREVTAADLLRTTLARIDDVNPKIRAIVALRKDREKLFEEARAADRDLDAAAAHSDQQVGWMRGISIAIKDLENARCLPTTRGGCPVFRVQTDEEDLGEGYYRFENGWVFENEIEDDPFVRRMRDAGALIIGKTNAPELGAGCHTYNTIHGTTLNPFNLSLSAGGSSGGAGAALSSHMLSVCDGSDMMGSLRNPAGWHNLYSLRPTSDWMQEEADDALPYPISTIGPMARCPEDLAMLLSTILPEAIDFDASAVIEESQERLGSLVKGASIGWLGDWGGSMPFEDGVLAHCKSMLDTFASKGGASIECIPDAPFSSDTLWDAWMIVRSYKIFNSLREKIGCEALDVVPTLKDRGAKPEAVWECERGQSISQEQLSPALDVVSDWSRCAAKLFESYDVLALPSSQVYPFDASLDWPKSISGKRMDTYHRWMEVMVPVTLLGTPCVTVPAGLGPTGLPMGIQMFAAQGKDGDLLRLACWYHEHAGIRPGDLAV